MIYPIKDCNCEDFPCCEHADNFPMEVQTSDHFYCDECGFAHVGPCPDPWEDDPDLDEEVIQLIDEEPEGPDKEDLLDLLHDEYEDHTYNQRGTY